MGGTSTISGGKLCLRIDPRVPTLSGCAASRGPTIKANTVPFSWIMASIHEGLVKDGREHNSRVISASPFRSCDSPVLSDD